jgi:hypothetical protein
MKRMGVLVVVVAAGLAWASARADSLGYANGDTAHGTLKEVTFRAGESLGIYSRKAIQSLELSTAGEDQITLFSDGLHRGSVVSVRFATEKGIVTVPRAELSVIGLDAAAATEEPKPAKPKVAGPKPAPVEESPAKEGSSATPALSAAQQDLVYKNLDLRNHTWDEAGTVKDKEMDVLKKEYMDDCTKVVREIAKLDDTIRRKKRARDDAERDYRHDVSYQEQLRAQGRSWHHVDKPTFKDGLEDDQKSLARAQEEKLKLQQIIRNEMEKLEKRAAERRKRVEAVYSKQKLALEAGQNLSREQMAAAYQEALSIGDYEPPVQDGTKKDGTDAKESKKAPDRKAPKK